MITAENEILRAMSTGHSGGIYKASDFGNVGSQDAIRKALQRLEKRGELIRLGRGIYLFPKNDPTLGLIYPSMDDVAREIARKEKLRIIPTGQQALLQLGLSTQVPMKSIYLTDGGPRNIKIGKRTLVLKPTTPKMLSLRGTISGPIIQALKELGADGITPEIRSKLAALLANENPVFAEADARLAPAWIRALMLNLLNK